MGSTKKHKKEKDRESSSKKHKHRSRSKSPRRDEESPDRDRERRHKKRRRERSRSPERKKDYHSDSSDVVEVPLDFPTEKPRQQQQPRLVAPPPPSLREKSPSPIPEGGLGDSLSIEETNKLRAKLGLKPLVESAPAKPKTDVHKDTSDISDDESKTITDDLGEFYHKPAVNITELKNAEKIREKIRERREKRKLEDNLKKTKTLGESDSDDDVNNWVERNREKTRLKQEAAKRAKVLEEMDEEFGVSALMEQDKRDRSRAAYKYSSLKGLKVEHDVSEFSEGKTVILTLKDAEVLDEGADTLVNVNIMDTEKYRKNVENRKYKPGNYGYECYEEEMDGLGMPAGRSVLKKYDDEIEGNRKTSFVIGSAAHDEQEHRRKMMELKCKLENKKLFTLNEQLIRPASDYFTEEEMTKFKKPKKTKKVKKLRSKMMTADDLLPLPGDVPETTTTSGDLKSRRGRHDDDEQEGGLKRETNAEDDNDLEKVLSKARRLKQKEALISKSIPMNIKEEVKEEQEEQETDFQDNKIILMNETAEFCRTLGDIPTYGMAGNREADLNDMMDVENVEEQPMDDEDGGVGGGRRGQWNSVEAEEDDDDVIEVDVDKPEVAEKAILDEPDVGSGVAGALRLAMSKGYLEREESNKPSNSRMAYLQAKNYSIDDKAHNEDEKFNRNRNSHHYHSGPVSEFRDKDGYKPNVKLEYIDDNGRILNAKEAFRYLSHKFHGKGPGKNKIEKRLKKVEQEGLMNQMSSTDTPLGTLNMLQAKQKETHSPFIILSGGKQSMNSGSIGKPKLN